MAEDDSKYEQIEDYSEHQRMARQYSAAEIRSVAGLVHAAGANEAELSELENLALEVENGKTKPEAGIKRANEIYRGKNMYH